MAGLGLELGTLLWNTLLWDTQNRAQLSPKKQLTVAHPGTALKAAGSKQLGTDKFPYFYPHFPAPNSFCICRCNLQAQNNWVSLQAQRHKDQ